MSFHKRWSQISTRTPGLKRQGKRKEGKKEMVALPKLAFKKTCRAFYEAGLADNQNKGTAPCRSFRDVVRDVFGRTI